MDCDKTVELLFAQKFLLLLIAFAFDNNYSIGLIVAVSTFWIMEHKIFYTYIHFFIDTLDFYWIYLCVIMNVFVRKIVNWLKKNCLRTVCLVSACVTKFRFQCRYGMTNCYFTGVIRSIASNDWSIFYTDSLGTSISNRLP